jgi:hypothetical protein
MIRAVPTITPDDLEGATWRPCMHGYASGDYEFMDWDTLCCRSSHLFEHKGGAIRRVSDNPVLCQLAAYIINGRYRKTHRRHSAQNRMAGKEGSRTDFR